MFIIIVVEIISVFSKKITIYWNVIITFIQNNIQETFALSAHFIINNADRLLKLQCFTYGVGGVKLTL